VCLLYINTNTQDSSPDTIKTHTQDSSPDTINIHTQDSSPHTINTLTQESFPDTNGYVCLLYQDIDLSWVCVFIVLEDRAIMGMCVYCIRR
jgi:hypothetical protein